MGVTGLQFVRVSPNFLFTCGVLGIFLVIFAGSIGVAGGGLTISWFKGGCLRSSGVFNRSFPGQSDQQMGHSFLLSMYMSVSISVFILSIGNMGYSLFLAELETTFL